MVSWGALGRRAQTGKKGQAATPQGLAKDFWLFRANSSCTQPPNVCTRCAIPSTAAEHMEWDACISSAKRLLDGSQQQQKKVALFASFKLPPQNYETVARTTRRVKLPVILFSAKNSLLYLSGKILLLQLDAKYN